MASISTGSTHGGKRALDHDVPLVPFIDLLLCCVMFLLVTAVWNRLAAMQAAAPAPPGESSMVEPDDAPPITVLVSADRYVVGSDAGDRTDIPFTPGAPDTESLRAHLAPRAEGARGEVIVVGDDGVAYASVIEAMDVLASAGFEHVTMGTGTL